MKETMLDKLRVVAEKENVFVAYQDMKPSQHKLYGIYFKDPECGSFIVLDESLKQNDAKHCAVFAEELGHHFAGVHTNSMTSQKVDILEDELAALRWAVQQLVDLRAV